LIDETLEVLVERFDIAAGSWTGRSKREAPEIDGEITFTTDLDLSVGQYVDVTITGTEGTDLVGNLQG
jgi:tRNA A37 methylthiotransferase MiaB